jgi:signal transduction histidine kinase
MVGILGFSEVLKNSLEDEEYKHYAEIIHKGGTRLMDTLNLILNISAIELDNVKVTNEDFDLISEAKEVVEIFDKNAAQKSLTLSFKSGFDKKLIHSDRKIVSQILSNLVNNAIKYTNEGSVLVKIEDITKNNLNYVAIKVIDTGIGIPEDKQELIWEEFRQVSEGLSRGFEGTGLGLSITKKFVDKLGGEIFIEESQSNIGSTFTVLLPDTKNIKEPPVPETKTSKVSEVIKTKETLPSVLYVDDDAMSIDLCPNSG